MGKPTLVIPKSQKQSASERITAKIADYTAKKNKGEKPSLDSVNEKLDLMIELLMKSNA
ncbi:hypothetical protein H1S01_18510 [Heliobacterium chlorum]|uniref:Uncharacterized protein n=1 Tax=Heliobacterium chlorum TaxID=2698 RepID=A0ABR7T6S2_HELCL|nr:hypothetical protein [Heliobacterium chlorum]MBC9786452.1 hypothetical protein [Heliobacterium chlorum]